MTFTRKLYKHKDNVSAQLSAGISGSASTIPLQTGQGASFPSAISGLATSLGNSYTLNSTGIQAALAAASKGVGDIICNVTDGSYSVIKSISTNQVVTTRLKGGSANIWANSDKWSVDPFVITAINYDTDGTTILKREKVLIDSRSGDNLSVNASGRGFDGSVAQSFSTNDYVYLLWKASDVDGIQEALKQIILDIDSLISQGSGEIYAADGGGTDAYAITLAPAPAAYVTGQVFNFKANTANIGSASLNVNGLGAKTIKKNHDQTLEDGDIESGQIVTVIYDGVDLQMQSQLANLFASKANIQKGELVYAADAGSTDDYAVTLSPAPLAYTTGQIVTFKANTVNTGPATLNVNGLGAKTIKKSYNLDLADGDIKAGQIVTVVYDGTNFQLQTQVSGNIVADQSIAFEASSSANYANKLQVAASPDGSELFLGTFTGVSNGNISLYRFERVTSTGQYRLTHKTNYNNGGTVIQSFAITVLGSYLYLFTKVSGSFGDRRYAKADLSGVTTMTHSGGDYSSGAGAFSDGTYLYVLNSTDNFYKYSVSGTVMTYVSTITYTSGDGTAGCACDGTSVWMNDNNTTYTIRKFALAGGAATATSTGYYEDGYTDMSTRRIFLFSGNVLGICFGHTMKDGANITASVLRMTHVTAP